MPGLLDPAESWQDTIAPQPSLADATDAALAARQAYIARQHQADIDAGFRDPSTGELTAAGRADQAKRIAFGFGPGDIGMMMGAIKGLPTRIPNPTEVWHGTPHVFDPHPENPLGKFDLSRMGTGEGAQAFGKGGYAAENKGIAHGYRERMSNAITEHWSVGDIPLMRKGLAVDYSPRAPYDHVSIARATLQEDLLIHEREMQALAGDPKAQREFVSERARWLGSDEGQPAEARQFFNRYADGVASGKMPVRFKYDPGGALYQAELHLQPEHLLDLDKPISQQSPYVPNIFGYRDPAPIAAEIKARRAAGDNATADWLQAQHDAMAAQSDLHMQNVHDFNDPNVVASLREAGLPGLRYLDASSRDAGKGTSNYVFFDPDYFNIVNKFALPAMLAGGAAIPGLLGGNDGT